MPLLVAILVALAVSCLTASEVDTPDISDGKNICQREAEKRGAECATVYAFAQPWPNPLGHWEMCTPERYLEEAQQMHGVAWPSDDARFEQFTQGFVDPPCFWACPAIIGANAYNGAYVPIGGCP